MIIVLEEKLEPADKKQFELLKKQMTVNPELNKMLSTPMEDIPQYFWLYDREDIYQNIKVMPLYNVLAALAASPKIILEFSKTGEQFSGFISYQSKGMEITAIKIASFHDNGIKANPVLAADLIGFLNREMPKRTKIEWLAHKDNKEAVAQYDKALGNKFIWFKEPSKDGKMWIYSVTKKI